MEWLYENNEDNSCRYVLGTVCKKPLVCIGINPSTAEPDKLDPTLKSVARISEANGFDSWIMINVYPQRATNPDDLHMLREYSLNSENMRIIEKIMKEYKPTIWAAWGTAIMKRPYLINCFYDIMELSKKYQCQWVTAGQTTKQGHPHHPLYLKKLENLISFDIDEYLTKASVEVVFSYIKIFNKLEFDYSDFYSTLKKANFIDFVYSSHLTTSPISISTELEKLNAADFVLTKALITSMLREDYFSNGAFEKRMRNGDVQRVLRKLRKCYYDYNTAIDA